MCYANQLTGFYVRATLAFNELKSTMEIDHFRDDFSFILIPLLANVPISYPLVFSGGTKRNIDVK